MNPRGIGGQLLVLLAAGILAANLIGAWILQQGTPPAIHVASRGQIMERIVSAVRIAGVAPQSSVRDVLGAMSLQDERFWFSAEPAVGASMDAVERQLVRELHDRLGDPGQDVRIRFKDRGARDAQRDGGEAFSHGFLVSVQLGNDRWLNSERNGLEGRRWWRQLPFSITAGMIPVLLVVAFFARRITRPVRRLGAAARRFGRGEAVPPLPLEGPAELRATAAAFNDMQARITRLVQDRMRLLAAVSHDLRTPITSLKLRAEMAEPSALRAALVRTLDEMSEMVEATLSFAREEAQQEPTRLVDLAALAEAIAEDQLTLGRQVSMHSELARLPLRCRPASLRRAFTNLVDNAVRYGHRARISLSLETGVAVFTVEDEGPGIPEDRLGAVFEPFTRLEASRSSDTGGVGLGLAIVRSCVHVHGGEITLSNLPGGGLRAEVRLPVHE